MLICQRCRPLKAFAIVFFIGFAVENIHFLWIYEVEVFAWFHGLILGSYFGLYWALWAGCSSLIMRAKLPILIQLLGVSAVWVVMDYIMANADFLAFPWNTIAHTQFKNKWLLQWASVFGEYIIAFFIVAVNFVIFSAPQLAPRTRLISIAVVLIIHGVGAAVYYAPQAEYVVARIASIQPSFLRVQTAENQDPGLRIEALLELTKKALKYDPDLIVWPEAAVRGNGIVYDQRFKGLQAFVSHNSVDMIIGYSEDEKYSSSGDESTNRFNQAIFLSANSPPQVYKKRLLMPFGEMLPHSDIIDWPSWLVTSQSTMLAGDQAVSMNAGPINASPIICWENLFSWFVRSAVDQDTNLLVDLVNDNWFGDTRAPYQHNVASVFRAVEYGLPTVISSNTGPSQIISSKGELLAGANDIYDKRFIVADVYLKTGRTIYYFVGDVFVWACILFLLSVIGYSRRIRFISFKD